MGFGAHALLNMYREYMYSVHVLVLYRMQQYLFPRRMSVFFDEVRSCHCCSIGG